MLRRKKTTTTTTGGAASAKNDPTSAGGHESLAGPAAERPETISAPAPASTGGRGRRPTAKGTGGWGVGGGGARRLPPISSREKSCPLASYRLHRLGIHVRIVSGPCVTGVDCSVRFFYFVRISRSSRHGLESITSITVLK